MNLGKNRLTKRQDKFAQEFVLLESASEAYKKAYDTGKMKKNSIYQCATRIKKYPQVIDRIKYYTNVKRRQDLLDFKKKNALSYDKPNHFGAGVYFIQCIGTNYFKIGITKDICRRSSSIQTGCPIEQRVQVFIAHDNLEILEKYFHQKYSENRVRGEWFALNSNHIEEIKETKRLLDADEFRFKIEDVIN